MTFFFKLGGCPMVDNNESAKREREQSLQRTNQVLGIVIGCVVLGVGGSMLYQNSDALQLPDRNSAWSSFWKKELSKDPAERIGVEFKTPEWEKNMNFPTMDEKGRMHWTPTPTDQQD